jgi:hypothetical protein
VLSRRDCTADSPESPTARTGGAVGEGTVGGIISETIADVLGGRRAKRQINRRAEAAPTPATLASGGVQTPAAVEPRSDQPIEVHALRLLLWVQQDWRAGEEILACDLEDIYVQLCLELWWNPLRWKHKNGVAHHFRLLNGEPVYRWVDGRDGLRHRLAAYPIKPPRRQELGRVSARRRLELTHYETPTVPVGRLPVARRHVAAA